MPVASIQISSKHDNNQGDGMMPRTYEDSRVSCSLVCKAGMCTLLPALSRQHMLQHH